MSCILRFLRLELGQKGSSSPGLGGKGHVPWMLGLGAHVSKCQALLSHCLCMRIKTFPQVLSWGHPAGPPEAASWPGAGPEAEIPWLEF